MSTVNDINKYKKAMLITKEISEALVIIKDAEEKLKAYSKYIPVLNCLVPLSDARIILQAHYNKHKKILNNKGVVGE